MPPWLFSFSAAERISADILLCALCILAKPNLTDKAAKHIREILPYQIGTLDVVRADRAHIKLRARRTRRISELYMTSAALFEMSALPPITHHKKATPVRP